MLQYEAKSHHQELLICDDPKCRDPNLANPSPEPPALTEKTPADQCAGASASSMTCYKPLSGTVSEIPNPGTGKFPIIFDKNATTKTPNFIQVPCGRCIGCKLDLGNHWGIRMMHEAQMHEENCFITLTFDNEHLPEYPHSLTRGKGSHMELFLKRLRNKIGPFRYYYCGEYGDPETNDEAIARPHYHLCLFGWEPDDAVFQQNNPRGDPLFSSEFLDSKWENGHTTTGELTYDSACYTARYTLKKITGDKAPAKYESFDTATGELHIRIPEYANQSLKPGIGATWLEKYHADVYPTGEVVIKGFTTKPPKYYDRIQEAQNPIAFKRMKEIRIAKALSSPDRDWHRLKAREKVKFAKISHLPRRS